MGDEFSQLLHQAREWKERDERVASSQWAQQRIGEWKTWDEGENEIVKKDLKKRPLVPPLIGIAKQAERDRIYRSIHNQLEERVERLVAARHDYPMWPDRKDVEWYPMDAFEAQYHGEIRHTNYAETIFLVRLLKQLRAVVT